MDARILILKDEAGRKDKVFLYDSHGDQQSLHDGRYSPLPKRVGISCLSELTVGGSRLGGDYRIHVRGNPIVV